MRNVRFGRYARVLAVLAVALIAAGCLLFVSAPDIEEIAPQTVEVGQTLSVPIVADGHGRGVELTYEIDNGGWEPIEGTMFTHTFDEAGEYDVTITASNGLRSSETSFTVTVTP